MNDKDQDQPASSVDPNQMLQNVASDLGLHCLLTLLRPVCWFLRLIMVNHYQAMQLCRISWTYTGQICHRVLFCLEEAHLNPCYAEQINMPCPFLIVSNPNCWYKFTYWMANSADPDLLQKPTDLDLYCLQRQGVSGFNKTRVKFNKYFNSWHFW